jgi:hypothetical protein
MARVLVIAPLAGAILSKLKHDPCSNASASLALSAYSGATLFTFMFMTGGTYVLDNNGFKASVEWGFLLFFGVACSLAVICPWANVFGAIFFPPYPDNDIIASWPDACRRSYRNSSGGPASHDPHGSRNLASAAPVRGLPPGI